MTNEKIVSKFGTGLNVDRATGLKTADIQQRMAAVYARNPNAGHLFVVSGATALGRHKADCLFGEKEQAKLTDKVLAGMCATALFYGYEGASELVGRPSASYAVTWHQIQGEADEATLKERRSLTEALTRNFELGITSNLNEDDGVNDKKRMSEIFGVSYEVCNELLAAHMACAVKADRLDIWKAKGGIRDDSGEYLPVVNNDNYDDVFEMLQSRQNGESGRGGPRTTLAAGVMASSQGIAVRILGVNDDMSGVNVTRVVVG